MGQAQKPVAQKPSEAMLIQPHRARKSLRSTGPGFITDRPVVLVITPFAFLASTLAMARLTNGRPAIRRPSGAPSSDPIRTDEKIGIDLTAVVKCDANAVDPFGDGDRTHAEPQADRR